jgi:sialic acid synthase SpsE
MLELRKSLDEVDTIMGKKEIIFGLEEERVAKSARRSLFASRDIACGEVITDLDIIEKRPGTGISADKLDKVIGKKALKNIPKDHMIRYEFIK